MNQNDNPAADGQRPDALKFTTAADLRVTRQIVARLRRATA
jgi:hypothetical protein